MKVKSTDLWWTPPEVVQLVQLLCPDGYADLFGAAGSPLSSGAEQVITEADDVFNQDTGTRRDLHLVANPPWSQGWLRAAAAEIRRRQDLHHAGRLAILIAPMRLETQWVRDFDPSYILIPPNRIDYVDPESGERPGSPRTSSCVYVRGDLNGLARMWLREHNWTIYTQHTLRGAAA